MPVFAAYGASAPSGHAVSTELTETDGCMRHGVFEIDVPSRSYIDRGQVQAF